MHSYHHPDGFKRRARVPNQVVASI
jgi:hypothetical protein